MSYAEVNDIAADRIPVIDIDNLFGPDPDYATVGNALLSAATSPGFFYVSGHCVGADTMNQAFDVAREFFDAPVEHKLQIQARGYHRGLLPQGVSKMEGHRHADMKESFVWGVDFPPDNPEFLAGNDLLPPNRWPSFMPHMRGVLNTYMDETHRCGTQLLRAIASSLEVELDYFVGRFNKPTSRGTLIHYPPQPPAMGDEYFGVSPHTDYGTMTLLAQDEVGGLRVQDGDGSWVTAHPIPGTLVVNVGDLLSRWSNDRFRSTPHAVVNASGRERYSIAVFLDPDWDTVISPLTKAGETAHYDDVLCADYIRSRFSRSFSYEGRN